MIIRNKRNQPKQYFEEQSLHLADFVHICASTAENVPNITNNWIKKKHI